MKERVLQLVGELIDAAPDLVTTVEKTGKGMWITFELPGSQTWWELECRTPDQIGLHIHVPNDPNDVIFGPPEEGFDSLDAAFARLKEIFQRAHA
jgi:hypothetical protein